MKVAVDYVDMHRTGCPEQGIACCLRAADETPG